MILNTTTYPPPIQQLIQQTSSWYSLYQTQYFILIQLIQQPTILTYITRNNKLMLWLSWYNNQSITIRSIIHYSIYFATPDTMDFYIIYSNRYSNLHCDSWYNNQSIITLKWYNNLYAMILDTTTYHTIYNNWYSRCYIMMLLHDNLIYYHTPTESAISMLRYSRYSNLSHYTWTKATARPLLEDPPPMRIPGAARRTPSQLSKTMTLCYLIVFLFLPFLFCYFVLFDICHSEDP
jgi:hypothetical protein